MVHAGGNKGLVSTAVEEGGDLAVLPGDVELDIVSYPGQKEHELKLSPGSCHYVQKQNTCTTILNPMSDHYMYMYLHQKCFPPQQQ